MIKNFFITDFGTVTRHPRYIKSVIIHLTRVRPSKRSELESLAFFTPIQQGERGPPGSSGLPGPPVSVKPFNDFLAV